MDPARPAERVGPMHEFDRQPDHDTHLEVGHCEREKADDWRSGADHAGCGGRGMQPAPAAQVAMVYSPLSVGIGEWGHDHQAEKYAARATRFGQRDWLGTATGAQGVSHVGSDQERSRTSRRGDPSCNHQDHEVQEMIDLDQG